MVLEPGLRKLRKMRGTGRRPHSKSLFVFAFLCLISCVHLSAAHEDQGLGVSRKIDEQVDGELETWVEKVGTGGKLDGEMGDAYVARSSSRDIGTQFVDDQSPLQTNRRSQAQGVGRKHLSVSVNEDTTQTNTTPNTTQKGTGKKSPAPPPPPVKKEMAQSDPAVVTDSPPPPPPPLDSEVATDDRVKGTAATRKTCEVGPVLAKLQATGDDGNDDYTLNIQNDGGKAQLTINIGTTSVLKATPDKLVLPKGANEQVTISVIDREAAKSGASINISWGEDDCQVNVPRGINIGIVTPPSSYLSLISSPGVGTLVIGGSLMVVLLLGILGAWRCASWRAQTRHGDGDVKYQELEMGVPTACMSSNKDEIPLSADGWDEVWEDDDWQDSEAVRSTSSSLTLSAKGLNSRRANKDGWDSSWDD